MMDKPVCALWPAQDMDKLEAGAFYLDRQPRTKHLSWFAGTRYTEEQVDELWNKLVAMVEAK